MRERLWDAWTFATSFIVGMIGGYAGRNAAKRVLNGWFDHLDVQNNLDDQALYLEANHRTGQDYCEYLLENPDFRYWRYRQVRDVWESLLWFNLRTLYIEREVG